MYSAFVKPWAPRVLPPPVAGLNGFGSTTLQDALFVCYKQSPDNAHSVAFSQRSSSPRLIEYETFNESHIVNNLIDYEDEQEEPDSLRVDKNMPWDSAFQQILKAFS
ncbi:uncharacterized protein TNCV_3634611 [Trichonephila clavipes]|nr:uncharacterized protein TNCV_3634611 [Trichonephila clavipes]